jgi:hypothetical protein
MTVSRLFYATGILGAILFLFTAAFTVVVGQRPSEYFGSDLGGGFIQDMDDGWYVLFTFVFGLLSALEIAVGRGLARSSRGAWIAAWLVLVPGTLLSVGFVLPIWLVLNPIKAILLLREGPTAGGTPPD